MKSTDLGNVITWFLSSQYKSILIDGPWGCGKTYQIREYIRKKAKRKAQRKPKVHYLSLFGKESIDEINTELYALIHPTKTWLASVFGKGLGMVSRAISPIPYAQHASGIADSLSYLINDYKNRKIDKNTIVVFDDLERVSDKISYISLLGYFSQLFMAKVRIVCICSSQNIGLGEKDLDGQNRKNSFLGFKEKTFDRVYQINETDEEIIASYFSRFQIENIAEVTADLENNIRLAQKVAFFLDELVQYSKQENLVFSSKVTTMNFVKHCSCVVKLCFKTYPTPEFKENKDLEMYEKFRYGNHLNVYGENIANGLYAMLSKSKNPVLAQDSIQYSNDLLESLLDIFLFQKYESFYAFFKPVTVIQKTTGILDLEFYYLSDENKARYSKEFFAKVINGTIVLNENNLHKLLDIITFSHTPFDAQMRKNVVLKIVERPEKDPGKMDSSDSFTYLLKSRSDQNNKEDLDCWVKDIDIAKTERIVTDYDKKLTEAFQNRDFKRMDDIIHKLRSEGNPQIFEHLGDLIVKNQFFLPDLTGDISDMDWRFSHTMAAFSSKIEKGKEFKDLAIHVCKNNMSNLSLRDRFRALIVSNIDSSFRLDKILLDIQKDAE